VSAIAHAINVDRFPSLAGMGAIAVDVETFDPQLKERGSGAHRDGYIAGIAIGTERGYRCYYPIAHEAGQNLPKEDVLSWLHRELNRDVPKIGANLIYDLAFLSAAGVNVRGPFYDVQVAEPLLDENRFTYSLDSLAQKYFGEHKVEQTLLDWMTQAFGKKDKNAIWKAPSDIVAPYAVGDVDLPLRIFARQQIELKKRGRLWDLFILESKLIPMLLAMRQRGVRVDLDQAEQLYKKLTKQQAETSNQIRHLTGIEIAPWSARSLAKVFDHLGLRYTRTPKTKAPSFTKAWLEHHPHPVTDLIRKVRHLDKLRETFIKGILEKHIDGRIYTQFHQLRSDNNGTVTGRMSSSLPNLQQITVRSEEGKLIRSIFIPEEGQRWFKNDWSQVEYRLIVHDAASLKLPGAQAVVDKYRTDENADFHQIVADTTGLDRNAAKTVNFGLAYGEGVAKLCASLGLSREKGEALLKEYHRRAPFIKQLSNGCMSIAGRSGEIETRLGRIRRFDTWEIRHGDKIMYFRERRPGSRRAFTHAALNARIQGSAADIMKLAMVNIWESGVCDVLGAPHLTVHDELDGSHHDDKAGREGLHEVKHLMETCVDLLVPLRVDASTGPDWGSCETIVRCSTYQRK
jgi:DNA polymerase I-like protein with 3'-5' exonuclease and polymerase domains